MPGSKRRALKKLLSPSSTPSSDPALSSSASNSNSLASVDSTTSAASGTSIASDSRNYMTDAEIVQQVELDKMEARKDSIGSGGPAPVDIPGAPAGGVPPLDTEGGGLPPAVVDAPPLEGQGDLLAVPTLSNGRSGADESSSLAVPTSPQQRNASSTSLSKSPSASVKGMYGKIFGHNGGDSGSSSPSAAEGGAVEAQGGGGGKKKSSKQKFAERQARKQQAMLEQAPPDNPNWDKQLEKERIDEVRVVGDACAKMGRIIHEITPDGHCMYHAIADQLASIGIIPAEQADDPRAIRAAATAYMSAHPDEFRFFLPSVNGEDTADATTHDGVMTETEYAQYCHNVEHTGEWGGEPEIQALSRAFNVPIHVIQRGPPTIVSHGGADDSFGGATTPEQSAAMGDGVVRISYHRRMYGLGEHYNSLRKVAA